MLQSYILNLGNWKKMKSKDKTIYYIAAIGLFLLLGLPVGFWIIWNLGLDGKRLRYSENLKQAQNWEVGPAGFEPATKRFFICGLLGSFVYYILYFLPLNHPLSATVIFLWQLAQRTWHRLISSWMRAIDHPPDTILVISISFFPTW